MKKFLLFALLSMPTFAGQVEGVTEAIKQWQPISVTQNGDKIIVVSKESRLTNKIYSAMVSSGLCSAIWLGDDDLLKDITEVTIMNKFKRQGFVFEGGKATCDEMEKLKQKESEFYMLGHTRTL